MNEMIRKRNEQLAKTVIKGLQSRNMSGYYAEDKEAALKQALELIPEGSTIAMGGCMSAGEIGLISALEAGNYHYIDRSKMDARAGLMAAYDADIFLSSANAITSDGVMVNIDGNSNRVSCIAQGPRKVIFIVGMNKVCADLDSAMKRARMSWLSAAPLTPTGSAACSLKIGKSSCGRSLRSEWRRMPAARWIRCRTVNASAL